MKIKSMLFSLIKIKNSKTKTVVLIRNEKVGIFKDMHPFILKKKKIK